MKILLGYHDYPNPVPVRPWVESWLARLRGYGIDVHPFCLTIRPPAHRLSWPDLDACWKRGDPDLLALYENLLAALDGFDVFVNWNGINLHPEFVRQIPVFKAYSCYDDPESSDDLSRPVAAAYDVAFVGNMAELDTYRSWGVRNVRPWPLGFRVDDYNPALTREGILSGERDVEVTLLCERQSGWRSERLDRFAAAFPAGRYHGRGWSAGFLPEKDRVPLYQRTRIGPNFHNSTGPINFRCFILPANGVMQLCDNRSHLGSLFEVGKEIVGFETVDEAIDLCRYYLGHEEERRRIAAAGWERALRDYNEEAAFRRMVDSVTELRHPGPGPGDGWETVLWLRQRSEATAVRRGLHAVSVRLGLDWLLRRIQRVARKLQRRGRGAS